MRPMRAILAALCAITIAASCWLATMFVVLHRADYERGVAVSVLFVLQSLLTLGVVAKIVASIWARVAAMLGAAGLVWLGGAAIANNLSGPHFEGYAVVIGAVLGVQGILTLGLFAWGSLTLWAKMHRFGN
jgi:hypothetical protein